MRQESELLGGVGWRAGQCPGGRASPSPPTSLVLNTVLKTSTSVSSLQPPRQVGMGGSSPSCQESQKSLSESVPLKVGM